MWYKDTKCYLPQKHSGIVWTLSFQFLHRRAVACLNGVRDFHSFSCPITFRTIQCSAHGSVCCAPGFSHSLVLVQRDLWRRHGLWHHSCVQPSHNMGDQIAHNRCNWIMQPTSNVCVTIVSATVMLFWLYSTRLLWVLQQADLKSIRNSPMELLKLHFLD